MSNLTLTIDDELLHRARIRALEHRTSVNALVRKFLERYARGDQPHALEAIVQIARQSHASSGPAGRTWTREELYER